MKKIALIFSMWTFLCIGLAIVQACDPCSDGPYYVRLASIDGEVKKIMGIELQGSYQNAYYTVEKYVTEVNGIRYDSIGIDIFNTFEELAYSANVHFFNSAFACDPVINYEQLEDITIISSEDYVDSYPAGHDLKEIMSVRQGYHVQGNYIPTYLSNAELSEGKLFFTFEIPPSQTKTHTITIMYKLLNGREFNVLIQGLKIYG